MIPLLKYSYFIFNFTSYCHTISIYLLMPSIVLTLPLNICYLSTHFCCYVPFHLSKPFSFFFLFHHSFIFRQHILIRTRVCHKILIISSFVGQKAATSTTKKKWFIFDLFLDHVQNPMFFLIIWGTDKLFLRDHYLELKMVVNSKKLND